MKLPYASVPSALYVDPSKNFTTVDPTTNLVSNTVNQITGKLITQTNTALQPIHSATAIAGPFINQVRPGSAGGPAFTFDGYRYMEHDFTSTLFAGTEVPMTVHVVASCPTPTSSTALTVFGFGSLTATTPTLALQYKSGNIQFVQVSTAGTFTASAAIDNKLHVFTAIKTATSLILRVDGVQVATVATTSAAEPFSSFVIGGLNSNGTVGSIFNGVIGKLVVQNGVADFARPETFLMVNAGLVLGTIYG